MVTLAQQRAQNAYTQGGVIADTGQQLMQFLLALMQQQEAKKDRAQDRAMQAMQMQALMQTIQQRGESGPTEQLLRELQLLTGRQNLQQEKDMQPARQRLLEAQATEAEFGTQLAPEKLALMKRQLEVQAQQLEEDATVGPQERALRKLILERQAEELGMNLELLPFKKASIEAGTALARAQLEAAQRENRRAEQLTGPQTDFALAQLASNERLLPLQEDVAQAEGQDVLARLEGQPARREVADATARAGLRSAEASAASAQAEAATAGRRSQQAVALGDQQIDAAKLNNALSQLELALGPERAALLREQISAAEAGNVTALIQAEVLQREYDDGTLEKRQAIVDAINEVQLAAGQISLEEARTRSQYADDLVAASLANTQASTRLAEAQAANLPNAEAARQLDEAKLEYESRALALRESLFATNASTEFSQANQARLGAESQAVTLSSTAQGVLQSAFSEPENEALQSIMGLPKIGVLAQGSIQTTPHRAVDPNDPADQLAAQNETVLQIANDYLHASDGLKENVIANYEATMGESGVLDVANMTRDSQKGGLLKLLSAGKLRENSPEMLESLAALRMGMAFNDELHPLIQEMANSPEVSKYIDGMPAEKRARLFSRRMEDLGFQVRTLEAVVPDKGLQQQFFKITNHPQVSRKFKDVLKVSLIDAANDPEQAKRLNTLLQDWTPRGFGVGHTSSASVDAVGRAGFSGPTSIAMAQPRGTVKGEDNEFLRGAIGDQFFASDRARGHGLFGGYDVTLNGVRYENANEALAAGFLLDQLSPVENPNTSRERFVSRQPQYGGDYRYRLGGERAQQKYEQRWEATQSMPIDELFANRPPPMEALLTNPSGPVGMETPPLPAMAMPAPQQMPMQMMPVPGAPVGAIPMVAPVDPMEQLRMILNPYSSPVP
jgi:hypothetical protein